MKTQEEIEMWLDAAELLLEHKIVERGKGNDSDTLEEYEIKLLKIRDTIDVLNWVLGKKTRL